MKTNHQFNHAYSPAKQLKLQTHTHTQIPPLMQG